MTESTDNLGGKWYAVPPCAGAKESFERQPHVLDSMGELVAVCETMEIAEHIAQLRYLMLFAWETATAPTKHSSDRLHQPGNRHG